MSLISDQCSAIAELLQGLRNAFGEPLVTTETIATLFVNGYKTPDLLLLLDLDKDLPQIDGIDMGQKSAIRSILNDLQEERKKMAIHSMSLLSVPSISPSLPSYLTVPKTESLELMGPKLEPITTSVSPVFSQDISNNSSNPRIVIKTDSEFDANGNQSSVPLISSPLNHSQASSSWASDESNISQPSTSGHSSGRVRRRFIFSRKLIQKVKKEPKNSNHQKVTTFCNKSVSFRYAVKPNAKYNYD